MKRPILLLAVLSFLLPALPAADVARAAAKPNVILILADDLGFETLGANGGTSYRTPVLDRLAATGARFTQCYAQPLCTPTRVQVMTGLYNIRNYISFGSMDPTAVTFGTPSKMGARTVSGGKGTTTDAGMHVPLIANWPAGIARRQRRPAPGTRPPGSEGGQVGPSRRESSFRSLPTPKKILTPTERNRDLFPGSR